MTTQYQIGAIRRRHRVVTGSFAEDGGVLISEAILLVEADLRASLLEPVR
jgi:hypothetical protein